MKSRARFPSYRVSGSDFAKTFKSRSRIFQNRVSASRRVSDFTIRHPSKFSNLARNNSKDENLESSNAWPSMCSRVHLNFPDFHLCWCKLIQLNSKPYDYLFVYHEYDYRLNWTTQSLITN